jgi:hypothetical protein
LETKEGSQKAECPVAITSFGGMNPGHFISMMEKPKD